MARDHRSIPRHLVGRHHGQPRRLRFQHRNAEAFKPGGEDKDIHPLHQGGNVIPAAQQADASVPFRPLRLLPDPALSFPAASHQRQQGVRPYRQQGAEDAQQEFVVFGPGKLPMWPTTSLPSQPISFRTRSRTSGE